MQMQNLGWRGVTHVCAIGIATISERQTKILRFVTVNTILLYECVFLHREQFPYARLCFRSANNK